MEMRSEWEAEGLIQVMSLADVRVRGEGRGLGAPETSKKKNGLNLDDHQTYKWMFTFHRNTREPSVRWEQPRKINKSKTVVPCGDEEC